MEATISSASTLSSTTLKYNVFPDKEIPSEWHVEAIDPNTGDIFSAVFGNADAEKCAREYADWRSRADR